MLSQLRQEKRCWAGRSRASPTWHCPHAVILVHLTSLALMACAGKPPIRCRREPLHGFVFRMALSLQFPRQRPPGSWLALLSRAWPMDAKQQPLGCHACHWARHLSTYASRADLEGPRSQYKHRAVMSLSLFRPADTQGEARLLRLPSAMNGSNLQTAPV
eukprot:s100_g27.t1